MKTITIIPSDNTLIVDHEIVQCELDIDVNIHAVQWSGTTGHIEYKDDTPNKTLDMNDYNSYLSKYLIVFENEKQRALKEEAIALKKNMPLFTRAMRDNLLDDCDYILAPDYPVSESTLKEWEEYRKALRNITDHPGFPWASIDEVPWPKAPTATH